MAPHGWLTAAVEPAEEVLTDEITVPDVAGALAVLAGAILLAVVLQRLLVHTIDRGDADRHTGRLVGRFLGLVVVGVGAVYALDVLGVRIAPLLGALGVGGIAIAFAAQDILQNLIAGVLLQIRRPLRVGEQISTGDYEGVVRDVNLRTVVLDTYDGVTVFVPNAEVLTTPIVNYTRTPLNRTDLGVGVAYDTDLTRAREVLLEACRRSPGVELAPAPDVWVHAFGESSVDLVVRYWHASDIASRWRVRNDVAIAVKAALDGAGMTIPFPQRVLWQAPSADDV
ncbi:mechanosensitive ion channel family protein [uncultured Cellulomonas sp.]|uniref:mechanosensitive ion channel family protein n=1 Tax=uncultured Cellulomonas sp. TaxID=189682 RepID=UPI00261D427E|nr:mechanosensitive ion channel family protein [uncultured Cellulomonas sp.]